MKRMTTSTALPILPFCLSTIIFLLGGCGTRRELTKEEAQLRRLYYMEEVEDREYIVKPAGLAVRPPFEPHTSTYMKLLGSDGIEFSVGGMSSFMTRDTKYYAGRLSAYIHGLNAFENPEAAISYLRLVMAKGYDAHSIEVLQDSAITFADQHATRFKWRIGNGGSTPINHEQEKSGWTNDAIVLGMILETAKGAYLVYLEENDTGRIVLNSDMCGDVTEYSAAEASAQMEERFDTFVSRIRFGVDD